jgi:hypothetical protein
VRTHSTCALGSGPALGRKPPGPVKRTKEPINQAAACSSSAARSGLATLQSNDLAVDDERLYLF